MRGPVAAQHFGKLKSQLPINLKTCVYTNTSVHKQPVYEFSLISDAQIFPICQPIFAYKISKTEEFIFKKVITLSLRRVELQSVRLPSTTPV